MSNTERERSEYVYDLSKQQMQALLGIAKDQGRPFLEVVMTAIDQFIEREKKSCQQEI